MHDKSQIKCGPYSESIEMHVWRVILKDSESVIILYYILVAAWIIARCYHCIRPTIDNAVNSPTNDNTRVYFCGKALPFEYPVLAWLW